MKNNNSSIQRVAHAFMKRADAKLDKRIRDFLKKYNLQKDFDSLVNRAMWYDPKSKPAPGKVQRGTRDWVKQLHKIYQDSNLSSDRFKEYLRGFVFSKEPDPNLLPKFKNFVAEYGFASDVFSVLGNAIQTPKATKSWEYDLKDLLVLSNMPKNEFAKWVHDHLPKPDFKKELEDFKKTENLDKFYLDDVKSYIQHAKSSPDWSWPLERAQKIIRLFLMSKMNVDSFLEHLKTHLGLKYIEKPKPKSEPESESRGREVSRRNKSYERGDNAFYEELRRRQWQRSLHFLGKPPWVGDDAWESDLRYYDDD